MEPSNLIPATQPSGVRKREHPCFKAACARTDARIHLPVAPACNISCNYCVRKHDCVNESRPGVTSTVLSPQEACARYVLAKEHIGALSVVGIAGPGDALANWQQTKETLRLIRTIDTEVMFCLSTNGLLLDRYADELADLGVSHVTVTMNAIDPTIGARLYGFVAFEGTVYTGEEAAALLFAHQSAGIKSLVARGVCVKVNTVLVSGINEDHAEDVSRYVAELGVDCQNITQMIPVAGSVFADLPPVGNITLRRVREDCACHIRQIYHCRQCRADAVGLLGEDLSAHIGTPEDTASSARSNSARPSEPTPAQSLEAAHTTIRIAVASQQGIAVDTHFGQAERFLVYDVDEAGSRYLESREVTACCAGPVNCGEGGTGADQTLARIADCAAVVTLRIGPLFEQQLARQGTQALCSASSVSEALRDAYRHVRAARDGHETTAHRSERISHV
jgi:nitrogenase cofactor biosynthesis protein NifB